MKTCSQPGCDAKHRARGYCQSHYMRFFNAGFRACDMDGCSVLPDRRSSGFCVAHQAISDTKRCPRCATDKSLEAFTKDSRTPSGRRCYCKDCSYELDREPCPDCGEPKSRRSARCGSCAWSRTGPDSARWEGGRTHNGEGYILLWTPDHPAATVKGYVKEHRLVMEQVLGRYLFPGENVHHINGVKDDNRPENLELWVTSQPKGQRPEDLVVWAREILERYAQAAEPTEIIVAT